LLCVGDLKIDELDKDLSDGVLLFNLLEILSGEDIKPKAKKGVKMKVQKVENLNFSLKFLRDKQIKLVNISAEDVFEQKKKLILGLIWTLILRFQIQQVEQEDDGKNTVKKDLLDWCNRALNPQGEHVNNFTTDWQNGAAFQGLVNYCRGSEQFDLRAIDRESVPGKETALNNAFRAAEEHFNFPQLLDAVDVIEAPDELSIMTYVSYFRGYKTENTACAAKSLAYGPGLTKAKTHREAGYTVELKNDEGERVKVGGTNVTGLLILGEEKVKVTVKDNKDGTYACTYIVAKPGKYQLNVLCEGQHVKDSPFAPLVEPSEAFAQECTAAPPTPVIAGEASHFVVQTRDASGNVKPDGGEQITAALGDAVQCAVADKHDGTYDVSYTPEKAGDFKLAVQLKGENIKASPFAVTVKPANPDASKSTAAGDGIAHADTDKPAQFVVTTRDRFGNECIEGGFKVTATLAGKGDIEGQSITATVADQNNGKYNATYQPKKAGAYVLSVSLNGAHIKDSPFNVKVEPGKATAGNTVASGDGLKRVVAGETGHFTVQTKDANNNNLTKGGDAIAGKLSGAANDVAVTVKDNSNGTYAGSYVPKIAGDYKLDVTYAGASIQDAPFKVQVVPAAPSAANTEAHGDGIKAANTDAPAKFKIQTKDAFGNNCVSGGADIKVAASGPNNEKVTGNVKDNKDGTYDVDYQPKGSGDFSLDVTLGGAHIKDAPFKVKVDPGKAVAGNTVAEGNGLKQVVAGETGKFVVTTKDHNGNVLLVGGNNINATFKNAKESVAVDVKDNKNGTYDASYVPKVVGEYKLTVNLAADGIKDSPFTVQVVPAAPSAANTEAHGDGIKAANTDAPAKFKVQTKDAFGNNCVAGGAPIKAVATGPNGEKVVGNVKDNKDGTYDVDYQPKGSGDFSLDVTLGDAHIKDAPFKVKVDPGKAVAGNTVAEGDGLKQVVAGETGKFHVTTKDHNGNVLLVGGNDINAALTGVEAVQVNVVDNKNGTYDASYVPKKVGDYKLAVNLGKEHIKDAPFSVKVVPAAPSAANTEAHGDGIKTANTDTPAKFKVQTKDAFGNNCVAGGADIKVAASGPNNEKVTGNVKDNKDGTYDVDYQPKGSGDFSLDVTLGGAHIKDAPFKVKVDPGKAVAGNTVAEGDGLKQVVAGETGKFVVTTKDHNGNVLLVGGNDVKGALTGVEAVQVNVVDNKNGTYDGAYVPKKVGAYKLALTLGGANIASSPFDVKVIPAAPNAANTEAHGDGIKTADTDAPAKFKVQTKDAFGNNCVEGGADIKVVASGPNNEKVTGNVKDNKDGTYDVDYLPKGSGQFKLDVTLGGAHIKDAPFSVLVKPGKAVAGNTVADGNGLKTVVAGETGAFTVQTKDHNGNLCDFGGNKVVGQLTGPATVDVKVADNKNGTYAATYVPTVTGDYKLAVTLDGGAIHSSPFAVKVTPAKAVPETTQAHGTGLESAMSGVQTLFTVQTRDRFDNACVVGGDDVTAVVVGASGETKCAAKDYNNGKYKFEYTGPQQAGSYKVHVRLGGKDVKSSPFTVKVATSLASAEHSRASGDGLKKVVAGETGRFLVELVDQFGNRVPEGGVAVRAVGSGPRTIKPEIKDNNDGTYAAEYVPTAAGDYKLAITVSGSELKGSPFAVQVVPAAAAGAQSLASGNGLSKATVATPGKEGEFVVESRDRFGNKCVTGGAKLAGVLVGGEKNETIKLEVKDNNDGTYACAYDIEHRGTYKLDVTIAGEAVDKSPYSVVAKPGATDPTKTALLDKSATAQAGQKAFTVQLHDKVGNRRDKGGDDVKVRFERPVTTGSVGKDTKNGTFDVVVPPHLEGDYNVFVTVDGHEIDAGKLNVAPTALQKEHEEEVKKRFPGASPALLRLLGNASPSERAEILDELRSGMLPADQLGQVRAKEEADRKAKADAAAKADADAAAAKKAAKEAKVKARADELAALEAKEKKARDDASAELARLTADVAAADAADRKKVADKLAAAEAQRAQVKAEYEAKLAAAHAAHAAAEAQLAAEEKAAPAPAKQAEPEPAAKQAAVAAAPEPAKQAEPEPEPEAEPEAEVEGAAAEEPAAEEPAAAAAEEPAAAAAEEPAAAAAEEPAAEAAEPSKKEKSKRSKSAKDSSAATAAVAAEEETKKSKKSSSSTAAAAAEEVVSPRKSSKKEKKAEAAPAAAEAPKEEEKGSKIKKKGTLKKK
jgi:hypothetical protein